MLISNNSILIDNSSNLGTNSSNLNSTQNAALKVEEKVYQDNRLESLSYTLDENLQTRVDSVKLSFNEATKGATLSQITNVALEQQNDILTTISDKLKYMISNSTTDEGKESIRVDVTSLLDTFDTIASDSNYQKLYTLQQSDTSTNTSTSYSFRTSEVPPVVLSTESIQSNTEGLGLSDLKNLTKDGLTNSIAYTQSDIITSAIETIEQFQEDYKQLLSSFKSSTSNLSNLHNTFKESNENTIEINFKFESISFDRNSILKEMGSYSLSQANALQSNVLNLLSYGSNSTKSFNSSSDFSTSSSSSLSSSSDDSK